MSYHTTVITSKQFYTALRQARLLSDDLNAMFARYDKNVTVFPYSVFYVYYEQYLTIWEDSSLSIGLSLLAIFVVTFIVTGLDIVSALTVLIMVTLIVINMGGMMWMWNISLNAVSLVNLVVVRNCLSSQIMHQVIKIYVLVCRNWSRIRITYCQGIHTMRWNVPRASCSCFNKYRQQCLVWHYFNQICWDRCTGFR